jgi:hypothetical protein
MTGALTTRSPQEITPVYNLTAEGRIANAAAVLPGPYGDVTRRAQATGTSRQALYRDAAKVLRAVEGAPAQ